MEDGFRQELQKKSIFLRSFRKKDTFYILRLCQRRVSPSFKRKERRFIIIINIIVVISNTVTPLPPPPWDEASFQNYTAVNGRW